MATLGSLVVNVAANAAPFRKGLQEVQSDVKAVGASLASAIPASVFSGIFTAGSFAGAIALFDNLAAKFREMKHEADSIGVSLNELAGIKAFAKQDAEGFLGVVQKINRTIGEAVDGSEEARRKFEKIGLNPEFLAQEGPLLAITAIMNKLAEAKNPAEKTNLLSMFGGRGAAAQLGEFERGSAEFAKAIGRGNRADSTNALLENHARGWKIIKDAGADAANGISSSFGVLFEFLRSDDSLDEFRRKFNAASKDAKDFQDNVQNRLNAAVAGEIRRQDRLNRPDIFDLKGLERAQREFDDAGKVMEEAKGPLERFNDALGDLTALLDKGLIDADAFDRAAGKAFEQLGKITAPQAGQLGAITQGSIAAFTLQNQAELNAEFKGTNPAEIVAKGIAEAKARDEVRNQFLKEIAEALKQAKVVDG